MKCSEITYKKVSELVLLPENPRTITKNDFERLVDSIKINGFWKHRPLAVMERDGKLVVLAGNQRLKAARKLKLADVPVILYSELTPDEEKDIILRDNINNGDWAYNALQMDEFWKDVDFGFIGLDFPSDDEIKVIKQQLNGEIEVWNADDYQQKHLTSVIDKANALLEELDAYDEMIDEKGGDTILWFWDKYKAQESIIE